MTWREYHETTKHSAESLRRSQHFLDWANMPNPYRQYEGVPLLDLSADPPAPEIPALEVLGGRSGAALAGEGAGDGAAWLSQLLFHSAAISAVKRVSSTGGTYALRVNPSSGNLHPTEFHFLTRSLAGWPDGLYHYRPSSHMVEQRARGDFAAKLGHACLQGASRAVTSAPVVFVLSSMAWREAWKYRDRAFRYCLHDIGHAWQALALAARAMGCASFAAGHFPDDCVTESCLLQKDEWPMLIIGLHGPSIPVRAPDAGETVVFGGQANRLSDEVVPYPRMESIYAATKRGREAAAIGPSEPGPSGCGGIRLPAPAPSVRAFGEVARTRRSALDFRGGEESMSLAQLAALLAATAQPFGADFSESAEGRFVQLYLYAHRVEGLAPGVYRHWPERAELETIKLGDQRVVAAALSLGQDLAGNACVAFSMIADIDRAARSHGDRGYRYVHFEAGAMGHRLYLAAEALGLRGTGIGAFFDDEVHRYLGLAPEQGQVVYHFAVGHPVPDPRLEA